MTHEIGNGDLLKQILVMLLTLITFGALRRSYLRSRPTVSGFFDFFGKDREGSQKTRKGAVLNHRLWVKREILTTPESFRILLLPASLARATLRG